MRRGYHPRGGRETRLKSLGLDFSCNLTPSAHWGFFSRQNREPGTRIN
ncbi:hypothetical protein C789_4792 [Microcystis aeruginosa FACHB-905 = DIANCHI905]|nr:hypothetical protein C789_4792 [Microcystis aeruginosa FACHB-905 = DIANCHI905]